MAVTVRDVKCIITAPERCDIAVVKVETSEPGLFGLGCATFTQRITAVKTAVEDYLRPMMIGRDVEKIEDAWQQMMGSSYWRNGPVLNNAISGVDEALWDIKGKMLGVPVYQLLGGKVREGVAVMPRGAHGRTLEEVGDSVEAMTKDGFEFIRVGLRSLFACDEERKPEGAPEGIYFDPRKAAKEYVRLFAYLRERFGDEIDVGIDVHERFHPTEAVSLAKALEPYKPAFIEDLLAPEYADWFAEVRRVSSIPMAMGELFVNPMEYKNLIANRLIDYVRCHISMLGGFTPAKKLAATCETFGVGTMWHGPHDITPVGMAAQLHLDLVSPNCICQEYAVPGEITYEMFPGSPVVKHGYAYVNDKPGWGVEFDEEMAKKYPGKGYNLGGGLAFMGRRHDGTAVRT